MLQNCEKTTPISSTINEWSQNQIIDDQKSFMASSSANKVMEKTNADPHQQPLKCPRCDSSNTKFCYYNNYSLSQPRHFCKACKRYWTRGGTLRNVPVGGGCRKNKRVKRQPSNGGGDGISSTAGSAATTNPSNHVQPPQIDLSPASNHMNNPLFYNLPTNPLELNFPFSRFSSTRVSSESAGFDLQPQMNGLGLGYSTGLMGAREVQNNEYNNKFRQIQDHGIGTSSSSQLLSAVGNSNPIFFGSSTTLSPSSTMASLLATSFHQQKFGSSRLKEIQENNNNFPGLMPYDQDMQMQSGNGVAMGKEVKMEGDNRLEWNQNNQILGQQFNSSDSSSLLWNANTAGVWFDPSNIGSSVPSLI